MSSKKIGDYTEEHLLKRAAEVVQEKTGDSKVLDRSSEDRIPKFHLSGKFKFQTNKQYTCKPEN